MSNVLLLRSEPFVTALLPDVEVFVANVMLLAMLPMPGLCGGLGSVLSRTLAFDERLNAPAAPDDTVLRPTLNATELAFASVVLSRCRWEVLATESVPSPR